jgi:nicotinate-nucleotide pyrophosphorylase (carboxylating)
MVEIIKLALSEDKINEDITTNSLLGYDKNVTAEVVSNSPGIISGIDVFKKTFEMVDQGIIINAIKKNGESVKKGEVVIRISGRESSILKAERTALNFLQRLSGISSLTRKYVDKIKSHRISLLDTRKTSPGMRTLEKEAVRHGGGKNHRMDLEEMAMVKDNHIKMAGTITNAVRCVREKYPGKKIEVEVKNLKEFNETISLHVDRIMLDNFKEDMIKEAVKLKKGGVEIEISGSVNLENIEKKAISGIDYISVGALTHSYQSLDLSLNIKR